MKCFTAQQSAMPLRRNWERRTADPKTIPGSPIADQSNGLKRGVPRRRSQVGEWLLRKCPALKWFTPSSRLCGRLAQSPLGATRFRLAGSQAAGDRQRP